MVLEKIFRRVCFSEITYLIHGAEYFLRSEPVFNQKFPAFYGTTRFVTAYTSAVTCPYPEPDRSSPCPHIPLHEDSSQYYRSVYAWVSQDVFFLSGFPTKILYTPSSRPHVLYAQPNSFFSISLPEQYWARSTDH